MGRVGSVPLGAALIAAAAICTAACTGSSAPTDSIAAAGGWRSVTGLPAANGGALEDVAVDGSTFVAVGNGSYRGPGLVWTSTDGSSWLSGPNAAVLATVPLQAVVAGPAGLVALGNDCSGTGECLNNAEAFLSIDGSAWKAGGPMSVRGDEGVAHALWTGSLFLAVGRDDIGDEDAGGIWTSVDGVSWTQNPQIYLFADSVIAGVAMTRAGLVAVGGTPNGDRAIVWTSQDGRTWTRHDQADFAGADLFDVVAGGPGYVAVGQAADGAAVWTSPDGKTWSRVPDEPSLHGAAMYGVAAGSAGLVAVGYGGGGAAIWASPDGMTWTRVPDLPDFAVAQAVAVAASGTSFVAVGRGTPAGSALPFVWVNH